MRCEGRRLGKEVVSMPKTWVFYRRIVQILMIGIFLLPLVGFLGIKGTLLASNIFGIPLMDPLAIAEVILAAKTLGGLALLGIIGVLLILGAYLLLGKAFCSWVCPVGFLVELANKVPLIKRKSLKKKLEQQQQWYWMLPVVLVVSFLIGVPVFQSFSPIGIFYRAILFGLGLEVLILIIILALELAGIQRAWCRYVCPLGAFYALWARLSPLGINIDGLECTKCQRCVRVCDYTASALQKAITEGLTRVESPLCTRCGSCIDICPEGALSFKFQLPALMGKKKDPFVPEVNRAQQEVMAAKEAKWEPSRREFLQLGGAVAVGGMMTLSMAPAKKIGPNLLRPPGAGTDAEFLSQCIRCGQCIEVCPEKALMAGGIEHGLSLGTPYFIPKDAPCTLCMDCPEVCPTGALKPLPMEEVRIGVAVIDEELCYAYHGDACRSCWNNCPLYDEALYMKEFQYPVVVEDKCTGCGLCEYACVAVAVVPAIKIIPRKEKLI